LGAPRGPARNGRDRGELWWLLLRSFFASRRQFIAIFDRYEHSVARFAEDLETDRSRLKLPADEVLDLLDLRSLEILRDEVVAGLKSTSHELFRGRDETDRFDHLVSNIYHELSILKEEHYTLKEEHLRHDRHEYDRFFREISEFYPKRLRHIRNLYSRAQRRLADLLPQMGGERILIRSLYLLGEEHLGRDYPGGISGLYRRMYPEGGEVEGCLTVARSFCSSGFLEEALEAYRRARAAGRGTRSSRMQEAQSGISELEARIAEFDGAGSPSP
jgi:hypothetical protein